MIVNHFCYRVKENETYAELMGNVMLLSAIPRVVCESKEHESIFLVFIIPDLRKPLVKKIWLKSNN